MNKKQKEIFEKYLSLCKEYDYIIDIATLASKLGYEIKNMIPKKRDIFYKETIAIVQNTKENKIILKNNEYSEGVCRFCVAYFLAKDYLGKLKETEIYSCIEIPDKEAYELAKTLILPISLQKNNDPEQINTKCKRLIIPYRVFLDSENQKQ